MIHSLPYVLFCMTAGIGLIVLLTARFRIPAFFALLSVALLTGFLLGMPFQDILNAIKDGFGNILRSLGLIIVLGTTLGALLEYNGNTRVLAIFLLRVIGERYAALAMSVTGFIVGLPIFCDSGFIVLSGLNRSIAGRTGISPIIMSVSLATGLYSVHCLIPPHPGAAAAAGLYGVDFGKLILAGMLVAVPAMLAGHAWARYAGRKFSNAIAGEGSAQVKGSIQEQGSGEEKRSGDPSFFVAFLPIGVPIALIAMRSFISLGKAAGSFPAQLLDFLGEPVIALSVGVLLVFASRRKWAKETMTHLLTEGAEKAGGILVIIGAGGAFGAVLAATHFGQQFGGIPALGRMGILFPFLLSFLLKTAQGSSTVAIITAATIVQPLLPVLGIQSESGRLLCLLSMGAGSMMISHANDAYFWVIAKFSGLEMRTMLSVYSLASLFMGLAAFGMVCIFDWLIRF